MLSDSISTYSIPQLRFKDKNGNPFSKWEVKKLRDIAEYRRGSFPQPYGLPEWYDEINGVPFVQVFDVDNNMRLKEKTKQKISTKAMPMSVFVEKGSIVLTIQGSIGRIALTQYDAYVDRTLLIIRRLKIPLDKVFFMYVVSLLFDIEKRKAPGGTIKTITKEVLSDFEIQIPSLSEQQKIASFLSSIDDWIENIKKQKEALEKYKKGLMQKIFSQQIRFKDENGCDFATWEQKKLEEVLTIRIREVNKPLGLYKSIGIRSHFKGTFQKSNSDPNENTMTKLYLVKKGDLIVNITFAWEGAVAIAKTEDHDGFVSHRFPTYEINHGYTSPNFFQYIFTSNKFKYILKNISPGGAGRNRVLNKRDFLKINILLPSLPEQEKITSLLQTVDCLIESKIQQIQKAELWKKGLLQKMFI